MDNESRTLLEWFKECLYLQRNPSWSNTLRFVGIRGGIMRHLQIEFEAFDNWLQRVRRYTAK